jgi:starch-binding outer membrane protein, SusD/RagB family
MKEYRKEYFAEGQLFYFLKAHNYSTYYGCGVETMTEAHYQMTLPDDEYIFGNNSK